jgi:heme-degrading monooxygenase HmoA
MIARIWKGTARPEHAAAYLRHLDEATFPAIATIAGHRGAYALRHDAGDRVEFTVITLWESLDAIRQFAGADPEIAVVPKEAQALLASYDERAVHWDVALTTRITA